MKWFAILYAIGAISFVGGVLLLGVGKATAAMVISLPIVILALSLYLRKKCGVLREKMTLYLEEHTRALESLSPVANSFFIILASGAGLVFELIFIRWHSSAFALFSYFKNFSLLAAFLGLGIGYAMGGRRPVMTPLVIPLASAQFFVLHVLGKSNSLHAVLQNPLRDFFNMGMKNVDHVIHYFACYGFLLLTFTTTVLTCIPLGHLASFLMKKKPALKAYGLNLIGSILGVVVFSLLALVWSSPSVWLCVASLMGAPFLLLGKPGSNIAPSFICILVTLMTMAFPASTEIIEIHSPYQKLKLHVASESSKTLNVNNLFYQRILDLRQDAIRDEPMLQIEALYYELPHLLRPDAKRVLILGSGTGNDVAAAKRMGVPSVDAVEIDPAILSFGQSLHPEQPYSKDGVNVVVEDARRFINRTDKRYDLIVYGLLDSHGVLSGYSSVRMDSFVYTLESMERSRKLLTETGIIALTYAVPERHMDDKSKPYITFGSKFFKLLRTAFNGKAPRVFNITNGWRLFFVIGPQSERLQIDDALPVQEITSDFIGKDADTAMPTDDWPFLYMWQRSYPTSYIFVIILLVIATMLILRGTIKFSTSGFSPVCFLLGAGFLLIETKGITELGLTFGNMWQVVSIVIVGILVMAFLANACVARFGAPHPVVIYGLLILSLMAGMLIDASSMRSLSEGAEKLMIVSLITLPVFFSGFAFSSEISRYGAIASALSSNLLGAMIGGFLEYNSMYFGVKKLYLIAMAIYFLAFIISAGKK